MGLISYGPDLCRVHVYDQLAMMAITRNRKWKRVVLSIGSKLSVLDCELATLNCLKSLTV